MKRFSVIALLLLGPIMLAYTTAFIPDALFFWPAVIALALVALCLSFGSVFWGQWTQLIETKPILLMVGSLALSLSTASFFGYISGAAYEYGERLFPVWLYAVWLTGPIVVFTLLGALLAKPSSKRKI